MATVIPRAKTSRRPYRFRYYLGEGRWENDWDADDYVPNEFGGADSVVIVPPAVSEERPAPSELDDPDRRDDDGVDGGSDR